MAQEDQLDKAFGLRAYNPGTDAASLEVPQLFNLAAPLGDRRPPFLEPIQDKVPEFTVPDTFSPQSQEAMRIAYSLCRGLGHESFTTAYILYGILAVAREPIQEELEAKGWRGRLPEASEVERFIVERLRVRNVRITIPEKSGQMDEYIYKAEHRAENGEVTPEHLLFGILSQASEARGILENRVTFDIDTKALLKYL